MYLLLVCYYSCVFSVIQVCMGICAYLCGSQSTIMGVIPQVIFSLPPPHTHTISPHFQTRPLVWNFPSRLDYLGNKPQGNTSQVPNYKVRTTPFTLVHAFLTWIYGFWTLNTDCCMSRHDFKNITTSLGHHSVFIMINLVEQVFLYYYSILVKHSYIYIHIYIYIYINTDICMYICICFQEP